MAREKELMNKIRKLIENESTAEFGYAGVADCGNKIIINTGKDLDLIITMEIEE